MFLELFLDLVQSLVDGLNGLLQGLHPVHQRQYLFFKVFYFAFKAQYWIVRSSFQSLYKFVEACRALPSISMYQRLSASMYSLTFMVMGSPSSLRITTSLI